LRNHQLHQLGSRFPRATGSNGEKQYGKARHSGGTYSERRHSDPLREQLDSGSRSSFTVRCKVCRPFRGDLQLHSRAACSRDKPGHERPRSNLPEERLEICRIRTQENWSRRPRWRFPHWTDAHHERCFCKAHFFHVKCPPGPRRVASSNLAGPQDGDCPILWPLLPASIKAGQDEFSMLVGPSRLVRCRRGSAWYMESTGRRHSPHHLQPSPPLHAGTICLLELSETADSFLLRFCSNSLLFSR